MSKNNGLNTLAKQVLSTTKEEWSSVAGCSHPENSDFLHFVSSTLEADKITKALSECRADNVAIAYQR